MAAPPSADATPIETIDQLVAFVASGCKPPEMWRIGTEHEKFPFRLSDLGPVAHDGPSGIGALLLALTHYGWAPIGEGGKIVALKHEACHITLEPGGQLELSGAPLKSIHQTCDEVHEHLRQVREVCEQLGLGMLGLGFHPTLAREDVPWMPKGRYAIMRDYMPRRGGQGLDMMLRTCTIQVNLDYASEADMVAKTRVGLALQPIATALFANSPFREGRPTGWKSWRAQIWTDTDPDRTGEIPGAFEPGFGFEAYVRYVLDVPMYFVYRDGRYIDAAGQSFRDFIAGKLPALPGALPTMADWIDHMSTLFPEVRIKRHLEMRGADGGPWGRICALPALWVGLLYDAAALSEAGALIAEWSAEDRAALARVAAREGLEGRFRDTTVQAVARQVLAIARGGLARRHRLDGWGHDETHFLDELQEIVETGRTPADILLARFEGPWGGRIDPIFKEYAY